MTEASDLRRRSWALLGRVLREQRRAVSGAIAGGVAWQLAGIVVPVVVGRTIDHGIVDGDRAAIWWGGAILLALGLVEAGGAALRHRMACTAYMGSASSLRVALTAAALGLDADDRSRFPAGEVLARASSDTDTVGGLYDAIGHTIAQAISVPVIVVALFPIDPVMAGAVALTVPLTAMVVWRSSVVWERRSALSQAAMGRVIEAAEETVEGFKVLRGLGTEPAALDRFEARSEHLRERATHVGRLWLVFEPVLDAMSVVSVAAVLWIAGDRVIAGDLEVGGAVTAVGLALFLSGPARVLGERILTVQSALASAERVVAVVDAGRPLDAEALDPCEHEVGLALEADHVRVARPNGVVADHIDLVLVPGELVVLDGPTGGGKSTLLASLAGLRPVQGGSIRLGGRPLPDWPTSPLRRRVVVCGPNPFLFAGTIADNLQFADSTADGPRMHAALDAVAGSFVANLPGGIRAELGERGVSLSGGQRQRLALARSILARPSILLLDGATSALDRATEAAVVAGIRRELPSTAIIAVTANPAVRAAADRVLRLDEARLEVVHP